MKYYLAIILSVFFMASCSNQTKKTQEDAPKKFEITSGVNISHWLSQVYGSSDRATFFTKDDVRIIDSLNFDHIRLPVDEEELWDSLGNPYPEAFKYLTDAIDWCMEYDIKVLVDLHIIRSFYFNASNEGRENTLFSDPVEQEKFFDLWRKLSATLNKYPEHMVAYELLNEAVAENSEDWNNLVAGGIKAIRELEPTRTIFVGSNRWQITATFPELKVPAGDTNLVLSFHNYDPLLVTHYRAEWTSYRDFEDSVSYPGPIITKEVYERNKHLATNEGIHAFDEALNKYSPERFEAIFKPAIDKAKELNLPLYCGEFGCLPNIDREGRLQYYRDITEAFKRNGIAYTAWDYKGLFGIRGWDPETNTNTLLDVELAEILTKK